MTRRLPACRPARAAFTLVEVVVATLLLAIAALGVASTSTAAAHLAATARAVEQATRATARIVDSLRSAPCLTLVPGSRASAEGTVTWSVTRYPGSVAVAAWLVPASPRVRSVTPEELLLPCE
jgi:prepilin-type N-terminal cleavage/methylation domain-containing protein